MNRKICRKKMSCYACVIKEDRDNEPRLPGELKTFLSDRKQGYRLAKPVNRWDRADD